jgi:LEA14-like dessication related protein
MTWRILRLTSAALAVAAALVATGCAGLTGRDPLRVAVVGIDPLEGQGLELRMAIKLRLQNPNESTVEFDGAALELEVNNLTLATGVSDQRGSVPRYGETVISVPVSVSAMNAVRQALMLADGTSRESVPYVLRGKLSSGVFGTTRFTHEGTLSWARIAGTRR